MANFDPPFHNTINRSWFVSDSPLIPPIFHFPSLDLPLIQISFLPTHHNSFRSKEDHVIRISKSVFVTNFLDSIGSRDLWSLCEEYGFVSDSPLIPPIFHFPSLDLPLIQISFLPTHHNSFRSKEDHVIRISKSVFVTNFLDSIGSRDLWSLCEEYGKVGRLHLQANAVHYERPPKSSPSVKLPYVKFYAPFTSFPSGYFNDTVKDIKNIPPHSSPVLCSSALVLDDTCVNVLDVSRQVMGRTKDVNSISNLRTILTNEGFMDVKVSYLESPGSSFARKRLCIKTSMAVNILETFKVIYKGKVFMVLAKELFTWSPCFLEYKDPGYLLEDESSLDENNNLSNSQQGNVNQVEESDVDEVSNTIFKVSPYAPHINVHEVNEKANSYHSNDPFGLYDLLRKSTNLSASKEDLSLSHPSGFTPVASHQDPFHSNSAYLEVNQDEPPIAKGSSSKSYPKASCFSQASYGLGHKTKKDWVKELNSKHGINFLALQEMKMESISHMDVKSVWGNSNYQFVVSGSIGNSGGILCVWEETLFKKVDVSIFDNFIALYGIWLPTNSKILIVTIVLGEFNEVRSEDERFGSIFHQSYAREFNHFISSSGLLEVKMEGYSFTWSYSSASKISKLDRFLVSEGIFMTFPTILAICLDRHLSDHHPIVLNEIHTDYGPTPFRVYHSWFKQDGFDALVENAWNSFTHNDSNWMILFKKKLQDVKKLFEFGSGNQTHLRRAVNDDIFKGHRITGSSSLSHLFYADEVVFIREWSIENL
nr:RNA-directed DNA polymerase, eukaryota [Tanacetum cinerariifolium]